MSGFYVLGLFLLALHLSHGSSSFFQSLGLNDKKLTPRLALAGRIFAWLIFVGYASIPVAVLLGALSRPNSYDWKLRRQDPPGPLARKWRNHLDHSRLVSPNNRRKFEIIVVGSGLAGGSAAATLGELGYRVKCFCFQDSPRRAHSIAAQGGINAAKNYQNDGDSVYRLFYDTIKGGDFRSREANVYRLAEISNNIIDQCVAQGVPFAREYGGLLANRSFGGAQVSRTFYARGQTGQQLLLGVIKRFAGKSPPVRCRCFRRRRCSIWSLSTDTPRESLPGACGRERSRDTRRMLSCSRRADMETCFTSRPTRAAAMSRRPIALTKAARSLRTRLHTDSSHVHPGRWRISIEADTHVRIAPE